MASNRIPTEIVGGKSFGAFLAIKSSPIHDNERGLPVNQLNNPPLTDDKDGLLLNNDGLFEILHRILIERGLIQNRPF